MRIQIPPLGSARVLVVGDVMLDRYWHGSTSRVSPEAPVPVVKVEQAEDRPGGAANVALNIAALGAQATLLGYTGADEAADRIAHLMTAAGVRCDLVAVPGRHTITKLRVISRHQQMIRVDFEDGFSAVDEQDLLARYRRLLVDCSVVILSDYGKGTLRVIQTLVAEARAAGRAVLVDPKSRDFSLYRGATLVTPNLHEFEAVVGPCKDEQEIVERGARLVREQQLDALLVTRGEHGMSLIRDGQPPVHLPTHALEVFDVTGAGDTVISTLAAGLAAGQALPEAMALSNLAAGIVVGKLGTATVSVAELRRAVHTLEESGRGIVSEDHLVDLVADARAHGERVVMTNGCFDILHAGHVAYLNEARRLGDRLVVAVNDDDSVKRLKGPRRPVNRLQERMEVLAGLGAVDWVVPFSEDTPERLICRVLPDVLVKGGDYRPEQIAGHRCVQEAGGEVVILTFKDGCSTTRIIESLQSQ